ncbi:hypothetical protein VTK56DRAFT_4746 [Thermocarpiscus australiensis]
MGDYMADYIERLRRPQRKRELRKPWIEAARAPFRDDSLMLGPPSCTAEDFETPRLRRCPFDLDTMSWESRIDGGLDGYVWKVNFGDKGPFILKVFWDAEPPEFAHYYAPQRECQNAALLQMVETAVEQAAAASRPVLVKANPETREDAQANLRAFSHDARLKQPPQEGPLQEITTIPRMRKCYGWLTLHGEVFRGLHSELRPPVLTVSKVKRFMSPSKEYIGIVYEYIDEAENDPDVVQKALDFFWLAGFGHTLSPAARNWKSGVLVDLADIVHPGGYGCKKQLYGPRTVRRMLGIGATAR